MWHLDSCNKLTPFGIGVNGCIDGFSHHIMWMQANFINRKSEVIAAYFISAVGEQGFCPKINRSDLGTENVHVNQLQHFLRVDEHGTLHGHFVLQAVQTRDLNVGRDTIRNRMLITVGTSSKISSQWVTPMVT